MAGRGAGGAGARDKPVQDPVAVNAIQRETIMKENRSQKLYTQYNINPYHKVQVVTGKPNSLYDNVDESIDDSFLASIHHAALEPNKKYMEPQTTSQEIGWITTPLISRDMTDRRLYFSRQSTEITKYMEAAWRLKEQTQNMQ